MGSEKDILVQDTEIEYVKCFSQFAEEKQTIWFTDKNIPDMYSHNFMLLKNDLTNEEINNAITKEIDRCVKENKSFLQVEANYSLNAKSIEKIGVSPQITNYIFMAIPTYKYHTLNIKDECTIEEASSPKVMEDGIGVDIKANSTAMGLDFAKRRIYRKAQVYNSKRNLNLYVCYHNNIPIGNCELFINNNTAKIEDFDILEEYQRKGFGTAMLRYLLKTSEKLGVENAYVVTDSEDTAKDMYRKCGFQEIGEKTTLFYKL